MDDLYEGKFFYEVVEGRPVNGPLDTIRYIEPTPGSKSLPGGVYKFVQVVDGIVVRAFKEDEILVTDRRL